MKEKKWAFRYKDTVKKTEIDDPALGRITQRTAEHLPKEGNFVITYNRQDKTICSIHSDVEILELELLGENTTITEEN